VFEQLNCRLIVPLPVHLFDGDGFGPGVNHERKATARPGEIRWQRPSLPARGDSMLMLASRLSV
jgi:hypothetical protein